MLLLVNLKKSVLKHAYRCGLVYENLLIETDGIEEFKWVYVPSFFFWLRFKDEWPSRNIEDKLFRNKLWDNLAIETVAEAKMSTDNAHWENSH